MCRRNSTWRGRTKYRCAAGQADRTPHRLHVGDIIIEENDIFGDGVNIAVRLEEIAEPGGVSISDDAHRQIRGKIGIDYDDMGPRVLKNIAEPMRVWRIRANGLTAAPNCRPGDANVPPS